MGPEHPAKDLWQEAQDFFRRKRYKRADYLLRSFVQNYPYDEKAPLAYYSLSLCDFRRKKYSQAVISLEELIMFYPTSPFASKALYLRALCYDAQVQPTFHDQESAILALQAFKEFVRANPTSQDNALVHKRIAYLQQQLSHHRLHQIRTMMGQGNFVAALAILQHAVPSLHEVFMPEALYRLWECQNVLGLNHGANATRDILCAYTRANPEPWKSHMLAEIQKHQAKRGKTRERHKRYKATKTLTRKTLSKTSGGAEISPSKGDGGKNLEK